VELDDGTLTILLRFVGRRVVPGFASKVDAVARGTPGLERGTLVMLNPLYYFAPTE
jgi:hypothetical protein